MWDVARVLNQAAWAHHLRLVVRRPPPLRDLTYEADICCTAANLVPPPVALAALPMEESKAEVCRSAEEKRCDDRPPLLSSASGTWTANGEPNIGSPFIATCIRYLALIDVTKVTE